MGWVKGSGRSRGMRFESVMDDVLVIYPLATSFLYLGALFDDRTIFPIDSAVSGSIEQ